MIFLKLNVTSDFMMVVTVFLLLHTFLYTDITIYFLSKSYFWLAFTCRLSEQALSAGFVDPGDYRRIWLAYIDYLRRRLDDENKDQFEKGNRRTRDIPDLVGIQIIQCYETIVSVK